MSFHFLKNLSDIAFMGSYWVPVSKLNGCFWNNNQSLLQFQIDKHLGLCHESDSLQQRNIMFINMHIIAFISLFWTDYSTDWSKNVGLAPSTLYVSWQEKKIYFPFLSPNCKKVISPLTLSLRVKSIFQGIHNQLTKLLSVDET